MRIIAGSKKGAVLFAPRGMDTRPTQAKTRESLFSIIQLYVPDADVLDLFAGSGALALEALSRGARSAALVDVDREAADCVRRNVEKLQMLDKARLYRCDWRQALPKLRQDGATFDLVFLDPPYRMTNLAEICAALCEQGLLLRGAMLVLEHAAAAPQTLDARFTLFRHRDYGDTQIDFYLFEEDTPHV